MEEYKYRVSWCPICKQGWVEIVKDKSSNQLFVCCEECETEWDDPIKVQERGSGTHDKYGQVEEPTYEEILSRKWEEYLLDE